MTLKALLLLSLSWPSQAVLPADTEPVVSPALARALDSIEIDTLRADLGFLASDELMGRDTPSEGLRHAARYIRARLERLEFVPAGDEGYFDLYELPLAELSRGHGRSGRGGKGELVELENVVGLWPGSDPEVKKEVIILSAHYDHVGARGGEIWNGADDNGSGTSCLLEVAEALAEYGPMRRSVLLLWVSGEEKGLKGSRAWTEDPTLPEGYRPFCNLNIDMIGRNAPDYLLITPTRQHRAYNGLTRLAEALAPLEGFPTLGNCDAYWRRSDHMNFADNLGIPVAFLFSDVHEDYHQPTDTIEKIDFDKVKRVTRLVVRMLEALQEKDFRP